MSGSRVRMFWSTPNGHVVRSEDEEGSNKKKKTTRGKLVKEKSIEGVFCKIQT
jgi:hypothetical protein